MEETENQPLPQDIEHALDEIDRILHQMLLLAELSASDSNVDRQDLQKTLERLQDKIDRIADHLNSAGGKRLDRKSCVKGDKRQSRGQEQIKDLSVQGKGWLNLA